MYSTLLIASLFIAPAIQGALADFAISSPALVQCKQATISWEPTKAPYNLIVVPASSPCGDAIVDVGDFNETSIQWTAKLAAGTVVLLSLVDADDNEAWSNNITVGANTDASCLTASLTPSSASAGAGATTTPAADATTSSAADSATTSITSGDSDSGAVPIGAANAGLLGSGAFTVRQVSAPLMVVSGLLAAFALSL